VAICAAESWTLTREIVHRLAVFERKMLRRMFVGNKINENWKKLYDKELTHLFEK
jgi:hypothetical protein